MMNCTAWVQRFRWTAKVAVVEGVEQLSGAHVKALDLRAGVALVQAALSAKGTSEIEDIHWVERGYEDLVGKLQGLGCGYPQGDHSRRCFC